MALSTLFSGVDIAAQFGTIIQIAKTLCAQVQVEVQSVVNGVFTIVGGLVGALLGGGRGLVTGT